MNYDAVPQPAPLESDANRLLFDRVRDELARVPRSKVHLLALLITPEDGVRVIPRAALAARLRAAGLDREAHAALHLSRGDNTAIVVWAEAGTDVDNAEAGFMTLSLRRRKGAR